MAEYTYRARPREMGVGSKRTGPKKLEEDNRAVAGHLQDAAVDREGLLFA